jgi:hypothetical protein
MLEDAHLRYGNTFVWSLQDESAGNAIRKVNYIREYQIGRGVPKAQAYNVIMFLMAALLVIGFFCNLFVRAVHPRFHMQGEKAGTVRIDAARAPAD